METAGWIALGCFAVATGLSFVVTLLALRTASRYRRAAYEERDIRLSLERAIGNGGDWLWPEQKEAQRDA